MSAGGTCSLQPNTVAVQTECRSGTECCQPRQNGDAPAHRAPHLGRMPTSGERRALVFIASVAALGVAVRGWREFHPANPGALAGSRTELARQIQAVDSAIAVTSSKRRSRDARATARTESLPPARLRNDRGRGLALPSTAKRRGRQPAEPDTMPRDPRQAYWDRSLHFDSVRLAMESQDKATVKTELHDSKATLAGSHRGSLSGRPPVDLDIAGLDELAGVSVIGPALARRIFSDRVERGPFGSIGALERIPGVTHAFAKRLEPFVTFSRAPRLGGAGESRPQSKKGRRPAGGSRP
ncbi:MAG: ComEA family DNA-binding protein [Gemmatimonadales bacterium]